VRCGLLCVSPRGDFPLNDDWIYAQAVQQVLETGMYEGHLYADPVVVFQAYYGALFSQVFGFNFTVLRLTTYVGLLLAAWGASRCAHLLGFGRIPTLLIGTLVLANPLLLNLGYTFMTDVPFLALVHWSIYWFLKAFKTKKVLPIVVASSLAAVGYLIRQFGVLLPMAFIGTTLLLWLLRRHRISWQHLLTCILPWCIALLVLQVLPDSSGGLSAQFRFYLIGSTPEEFILNTFRHIAKHGTYLGLFLLPLTLTKVWLLLSRQEKWSAKKWCAFGGGGALLSRRQCPTHH
jgi:hypothetical protein